MPVAVRLSVPPTTSKAVPWNRKELRKWEGKVRVEEERKGKEEEEGRERGSKRERREHTASYNSETSRARGSDEQTTVEVCFQSNSREKATSLRC